MSNSPALLVVLAAGPGSRFSGPTHKLLSPLADSTVIDKAIHGALESGAGLVAVVTGATPIDVPEGVIQIANPNWQRGLATSLQTAIGHARDIGACCLVVGLGDQPLVTPEAWRLVASARGPIAVATYDGVRGNPVKIEPSTWGLMPDEGEEGARLVMRQHPEWVTEIPCPGSPIDVDTTQDLESVRRAAERSNN